MPLHWPWSRPTQRTTECLVFSLGPDRLDWVTGQAHGTHARLTGHGRLPRDPHRQADWQRSLRQIGRKGCDTAAVLAPESYQMLQIEAPAVPSDEMRAAARWRIKDLIDSHIDDVTLDVLRLGLPASQVQGQPQMFVVTSTNADVAASSSVADDAGWRLTTIDVADLALRNLQAAAAAAMDLEDRATACLSQHGNTGLLTICAGGELFYSRRLDWDASLAERAAQPVARAPSPNGHHDGSDEPGYGLLGTELTGFATELGGDSPPRMVIELQRSFDVWERSWPDLPLALLMLHPEPALAQASVAGYLQDALGLRVVPLNLAAELDGLDDQPDTPQPAPALLGTLLRMTGVRA